MSVFIYKDREYLSVRELVEEVGLTSEDLFTRVLEYMETEQELEFMKADSRYKIRLFEQSLAELKRDKLIIEPFDGLFIEYDAWIDIKEDGYWSDDVRDFDILYPKPHDR